MVGQVFPDAVQAVEYLERRMVEQKARDRRQKFLEDHQRIRNRRKNEPCIPFLPGHDQEAWFAKLELSGIWKIVFEYLTDPSDISSAYFTCEMFRKHLERKMKMIMLSKVFEILRETSRLEYSGFKDKGGCGCFGGRICNEKKAESRDVLKLRLVSKAWKISTEEAFLVPWGVPEPLPIWNYGWGLDFWCGPMVCQFNNVKDVSKALKMLKNPNSCASLVRVISVNDENCGKQNVFYSKLAQFLDLHGRNTWALCFDHLELSASRDLNYEGLCNIVSKMPHLKALCLDFNWDCVDDFDVGTTARLNFKNSHARLNSRILRRPFPSIPSLECLHFESQPAQYECLVGEILTKNLNVKAVSFNEWDTYDTSNVIPRFVWNALGNLRLETLGFKYVALGNLCVEHFLQLRRFDWPLKFLQVHFENYGGDDDVEISASDIFEVLTQFNDTLVEFDFETANMCVVNDDKSVVVDFPKLESIDLPRIED